MYSLNAVVSKDKLSAFCQKNHIIKLSLFGSALKDQLRSDSDIDLLVEFEEGYVPGLLDFARIENELTKMVNRKVDLRTQHELSRYFREEVLLKAKTEYAL